MRDLDIRLALREQFGSVHKGDPDTVIVDELGLCRGTARIDMVVINGSLNGFEIKSERDTLERLPAQQEIYSKILDTVTLVTGEKHAKKVLEMVPAWWGLTKAIVEDGKIKLTCIRTPNPNPNVDPLALAQLLWRDEALALLTEFRLDKGLRNRPRRALWQKLAEHVSAEVLGALVRERLKTRKNWRVVR